MRGQKNDSVEPTEHSPAGQIEAARRCAIKADRFRLACKYLRWSNRIVAEQLGIDDRLVRRLYSGRPEYEVPDELLAWIEPVVECLRRKEPPRIVL